jgi:simple sugar transport system permease protein
MGAGVAFAALMALVAVNAGGDQIVCGIGINVLSIGVTTFAFDQIFGGRAQQVILEPVPPATVPGLSDLGGVGKALFSNDPVLYATFLLVPIVGFVLYRTTWGLAVRAAGETPVAADAAGISVRRVRWVATLTAGALSGLAGAYLAVVQLGIFRQEMSAGRGFLALAAVIFGRWRPLGVLGACLLFGGADALQLRLQGSTAIPRTVWAVIAILAAAYAVYRSARARGRRIGTPVIVGGLLTAVGVALLAWHPSKSLPSQFWLAVPFVLALVALVSASGRLHMPAALTVAYRRGER